jgi:hypothetical protein
LCRKGNTFIKKQTIIENSPLRKNTRRATDFSKFELQKYEAIEEESAKIEDGHDFYEVDLSDEEKRKETKVLMSMRRKTRKNLS